MNVQQVRNCNPHAFCGKHVKVGLLLGNQESNALKAAEILEKECGKTKLKIVSGLDRCASALGMVPISEELCRSLGETVSVLARKSLFAQAVEMPVKGVEVEDFVAAGKEVLRLVG